MRRGDTVLSCAAIMETNRLEAFSDGVLAIIITIMVLELRPPHGGAWAELQPLLPKFLAYALSFVFIGIYWNNHHHMLHATDEIRGGVLWANLHMLFWVSLVPFVTAWMGENPKASGPAALYGVVMLMSAVGYKILQESILACKGRNPRLRAAIGSDTKGYVSLALYVAAVALAFYQHWIADAIYVTVALIWLAPDRRIERALDRERV